MHELAVALPVSQGRPALIKEILEGGEDLEALLRSELQSPTGAQWVHDFLAAGMGGQDLSQIERLASIYAKVRWGADEAASVADPDRPPLSGGKLLHDLQQLHHLKAGNQIGNEADILIDAYSRALDTFSGSETESRRTIDPDKEPILHKFYGRVIHVNSCPRLPEALSGQWNRKEAQSIYLDNPPGVVVIDDFLSSHALLSLRQFCEGSTVWHRNRYASGRLGSFFLSGFSCPLLAQISEELRQQLPLVIGRRHPLRQLWGFKYPANLPADSTIHADFAAVNVNFWVTPEAANNDPKSGGLIIYEHDAPPDWDFATYNSRMDLIKEFLSRKRSRSAYIPYRENRAIIFNSDLFHATAAVDFKPGYTNRRVNITMLYGDRRNDQHHPNTSANIETVSSPQKKRLAWRSLALKGRLR
jgi:hypothetical protein